MDPRIKFALRDLGAADATSGRLHRSADEMRGFLMDVVDKYAHGSDVSITTPLNAYAKAYKRATRGESLYFERASGTMVTCTLCEELIGSSPHNAAAHMLSPRHFIRAGLGQK